MPVIILIALHTEGIKTRQTDLSRPVPCYAISRQVPQFWICIMAWLLSLVMAMLLPLIAAIDGDSPREKRVGLFDVVRFKNEACASGSNGNIGTCYTSDECSAKGGTSTASCASGYGVCCVFTVGCGSTTSFNSTYLVQSTTAGITSPCVYTICPCDNTVCRIRFDFISNVLAGPVSGTITAIGTGAAGTQGGALGDCTTDSFTITSPGTTGTPVVCGFNSGQHMIVDAADSCHKAVFKFGTSAGVTRQWNIKVTQYSCVDDTLLGGPPGCLQYFTGNTGVISSYNFPTTSSTVATATTNLQHLNNQCYEICIRRNYGRCFICFWGQQAGSFGLSVSGNAIAESVTQGGCSTDFIVIPGAQSAANAAISANTIAAAERICGRFLNFAGAANAEATVCTKMTPFRVTFKTDGNELTGSTAATMANQNELNGMPSGTVGFSLSYSQTSC